MVQITHTVVCRYVLKVTFILIVNAVSAIAFFTLTVVVTTAFT